MMTRRAALLIALLLPLATLVFGVSAASAGTCPTDPSGVLEKTSYRVGERLDFYGTFTDFADPGTVTITFTKSGSGATRTFTAFNIADGSWMRDVTFRSRADAGAWRVQVVVDQTSGTNTCNDSFRLTTSGGGGTAPVPTPPNTDAVSFVRGSINTPTVALVFIGLGTLLVLAAGGLAARRRRLTD